MRRTSILLEVKPLTGEPDAGDPPVRFGGRGAASQCDLPTLSNLQPRTKPASRERQRPEFRSLRLLTLPVINRTHPEPTCRPPQRGSAAPLRPAGATPG